MWKHLLKSITILKSIITHLIIKQNLKNKLKQKRKKILNQKKKEKNSN